MTVLKSDFKKLEILLQSATNARQRNMYQALLDKAHQDAEHQVSPSTEEADLDTPPKVTSSSKHKQQEHTIQQIPEDKPQASELNTIQQADPQKLPVEKTEKTFHYQDNNLQAVRQSHNKEKTIFQAVGLLRCSPEINEDKLYITIDGQPHDLRRGKWGLRKHFDKLKLGIEQNGSKEIYLRVYPKVVHNLSKQTICSWFTPIKAYSDISQTKHQSEDFVLRGIWQYVPYCSQPVISIYRNIEMLRYFKSESTRAAKKAFARPQDFPVAWSAPIQPYRYDPNLGNHNQMPRYFVQVRAIFTNGQFEGYCQINRVEREIIGK